MSAVPGLTLVFVQAVVDLDYTPVVFGLVAHTSQRAALAVQKGWSPCRYVTWEFSFVWFLHLETKMDKLG